MNINVYNTVKSVMGDNVPEYIWLPIMQAESGGDPGAVSVSSKEYSVGLFQINRKAHPEYSLTDLMDPAKNAEIALKDFILPEYNKIKGSSKSQLDEAIDVYKNGIRPKWTSSLQTRFSSYVNDFLSGKMPSLGNDAITGGVTISQGSSGAAAGSSGTDTGNLTFFQTLTKIIMIAILVVFLLFVILKAFNVDIAGIATRGAISSKGGN
jgi:hypothetical protein